MTPTIIWPDGEGKGGIIVTPPEVVHGLMRDGVWYGWLVEPRPNRFDTEAWIEVIWSTSPP